MYGLLHFHFICHSNELYNYNMFSKTLMFSVDTTGNDRRAPIIVKEESESDDDLPQVNLPYRVSHVTVIFFFMLVCHS